MKEIKISIQIKSKDMFDFLIYHTYTHLSGLVGLCISMASLIMLIVNFNTMGSTGLLILALGSALFTVIYPIQLSLRAKQQVLLTPMYKEPLNYTFNEEGIEINQNDEDAKVVWEDITKVVKSPKSVLIYTSKVRAFIIPKYVLESNYNELINLMTKKLDKKILKIKVK